MQLVGTILLKVRTDRFGFFRYRSIVPLFLLAVMVTGILPALASEAFATDSTTPTHNGRVSAVASAQVIKPFPTNSTGQDSTTSHYSAITVSRRTTFRNCEILLGIDAKKDGAASCELRLIELQ